MKEALTLQLEGAPMLSTNLLRLNIARVQMLVVLTF